MKAKTEAIHQKTDDKTQEPTRLKRVLGFSFCFPGAAC